MTTFLNLISGIAWTIVYIESIRIDIKDKTYAMPFWALALNITWELLHGILDIAYLGFSLQPIINCIWVIFDIGILYTYFKYGYKYVSKDISKNHFVIWVIAGLSVALVIHTPLLIGTLAPTLLIGIYRNSGISSGNFFIIIIGVLIAFYDIAYTLLLSRQKQML